MEKQVLIENLKGIEGFVQSKRCESGYSFQLALALGLIDILIIGCRKPEYSNEIFQKINEMLNKVRNKINDQDFEGVSKLLEIMNSPIYPIGTHDSWLSLYLTENYQQIVDRLINVFRIITDEISEGLKVFQFNQKTNDEKIDSILRDFSKRFNVVVKFLKYSGTIAMDYCPENYGDYPAIYLMRHQDGNIMLAVHEKFIAAKENNTKVFDLSTEPFTISKKAGIISSRFDLSYNLPGIGDDESNPHSKINQNMIPGQNHRQPSPPSPLSPIAARLEALEKLKTPQKPVESRLINHPQNEDNLVLTEDEACDKVIQLLADLILKNNFNTNEIKLELTKVCNSSTKLKSHESISKILHYADQCKSCGTKYTKEDFSLIECEDLSLCMICNKCRWKNEQGICVICKRLYTEYEKEIIEFAKDY